MTDARVKRYLAIGAAAIGAANAVLLSQSDVTIPPWFRLTLIVTNAVIVAVALVIDPNPSHSE